MVWHTLLGKQRPQFTERYMSKNILRTQISDIYAKWDLLGGGRPR